MAADLKKESKSIPNPIKPQKAPHKVAKTTPPSKETTPRFHFYTSVGSNKNSPRGRSQLKQLDLTPEKENEDNKLHQGKQSKSSLANAPKLKIQQDKTNRSPPPYIMTNTGLASMLSGNKMKALDKARSNFRQRQILNYHIYTKKPVVNPHQNREKVRPIEENREEEDIEL